MRGATVCFLEMDICFRNSQCDNKAGISIYACHRFTAC